MFKKFLILSSFVCISVFALTACSNQEAEYKSNSRNDEAVDDDHGQDPGESSTLFAPGYQLFYLIDNRRVTKQNVAPIINIDNIIVIQPKIIKISNNTFKKVK